MRQGDLVDQCALAFAKGVVVDRITNAGQLDSRYRALRASAREAVNLLDELGERLNHRCNNMYRIAEPLHYTKKLLQLSTYRRGVHVADTVTTTWVESRTFGRDGTSTPMYGPLVHDTLHWMQLQIELIAKCEEVFRETDELFHRGRVLKHIRQPTEDCGRRDGEIFNNGDD